MGRGHGSSSRAPAKERERDRETERQSDRETEREMKSPILQYCRGTGFVSSLLIPPDFVPGFEGLAVFSVFLFVFLSFQQLA
jgi:hypothetical protein